MPSVKNPNGPSKNRLAARRASVKKDRQKKSAAGKSTITKAQTKRGARPGILPTSGPGRALSAKKQKKLQRQIGYALKRKTEADGEVEMKDATESKDGKKGVTTAEEKMEVDDDIS